MSPELLKLLAVSIPLFFAALLVFDFFISGSRLNRKHRRFMAANNDFHAAMEQLKRARTDRERLIRGQRAEECLEMLEAIRKEEL